VTANSSPPAIVVGALYRERVEKTMNDWVPRIVLVVKIEQYRIGVPEVPSLRITYLSNEHVNAFSAIEEDVEHRWFEWFERVGS